MVWWRGFCSSGGLVEEGRGGGGGLLERRRARIAWEERDVMMLETWMERWAFKALTACC
jgi:hypothetical protein